jgi:eukaryotic-like serine/threonine-protein kinase
VRAGLLPRLTLPGTIPEIDLWRAAVVAPGPDPFLSLAECLFTNAALGPELRQGAFRTRELLAKQLASDLDTAVAPIGEALDKTARAHQRDANFDAVRPARLALAIDQAERLFVEAHASAATAFAELLAALVRRNLAYVVFALRSDVYGRFQSLESLVALREAGATFDLVAPTSAELEEIVTRPVTACHPPLAFEQKDGRSLASTLVADARGGDVLPLLQMTLSRLYAAEGARGDGVLRFADYRGMDAAVTEAANEALETLDDEARAELPALVTGLVIDIAADPLTGAPMPIIAALDRKTFEAQEPARKVLVEAFVGKRLLTAEGNGVFERVRPVHEALLRIWPQAVAILAENAALIRVRHTLEPARQRRRRRHRDATGIGGRRPAFHARCRSGPD